MRQTKRKQLVERATRAAVVPKCAVVLFAVLWSRCRPIHRIARAYMSIRIWLFDRLIERRLENQWRILRRKSHPSRLIIGCNRGHNESVLIRPAFNHEPICRARTGLRAPLLVNSVGRTFRTPSSLGNKLFSITFGRSTRVEAVARSRSMRRQRQWQRGVGIDRTEQTPFFKTSLLATGQRNISKLSRRESTILTYFKRASRPHSLVFRQKQMRSVLPNSIS